MTAIRTLGVGLVAEPRGESRGSVARSGRNEGAARAPTPASLPGLLFRNALAHPRGVALRAKQRGIWVEWTWEEVADEVAAVAGGLRAAGLAEGDRVAVAGDARPWILFCILAAQTIGADVVLLPTSIGLEELRVILSSAGVRLAVAGRAEDLSNFVESGYFVAARAPIVHSTSRVPAAASELALFAYGSVRGEDVFDTGERRAFWRRENAPLDQFKATFHVIERGPGGEGALQAVPLRALVSGDDEVVARFGLGPHDDLLLPPDLHSGRGLVSAIGYWLGAAFHLNLPENESTWLADRREIGPTFDLGLGTTFEGVALQTEERLPRAGSWRRRFAQGVLGACARVAASDQGESRAVGDRVLRSAGAWAIVRPLRDVLGLSRVRFAVSLDRAPSATAATFFLGLGMSVQESLPSAASSAAPVRPERPDPADRLLAGAVFSADVIAFAPGCPAVGDGLRVDSGRSRKIRLGS